MQELFSKIFKDVQMILVIPFDTFERFEGITIVHFVE